MIQEDVSVALYDLFGLEVFVDRLPETTTDQRVWYFFLIHEGTNRVMTVKATKPSHPDGNIIVFDFFSSIPELNKSNPFVLLERESSLTNHFLFDQISSKNIMKTYNFAFRGDDEWETMVATLNLSWMM